MPGPARTTKKGAEDEGGRMIVIHEGNRGRGGEREGETEGETEGERENE